jgi:hypothetical protein
MKSKHAQFFVLFCLHGVMLSGCTSALWEEDRFTHYHSPADPPNLRLLHARGATDVLVQYDELGEGDNYVRRRSYWAARNAWQTRNTRKPVFVDAREAIGLAPVPTVKPARAATLENSGDCFAVVSTNVNVFVLYCQGEEPTVYELPNYNDNHLQRVKQVALTPAAVAVDATVVGAAVAVVIALIHPGAGGSPPPCKPH